MSCLRTCFDKTHKNYGYEDCLTCKDNDSGIPKTPTFKELMAECVINKMNYPDTNPDKKCRLEKIKQTYTHYENWEDMEFLLNIINRQSKLLGNLQIVELLAKCKHKLWIYRSNTDGEYLGGVEYESLIWQIDEMSKKITSVIFKEALDEKV